MTCCPVVRTQTRVVQNRLSVGAQKRCGARYRDTRPCKVRFGRRGLPGTLHDLPTDTDGTTDDHFDTSGA